MRQSEDRRGRTVARASKTGHEPHVQRRDVLNNFFHKMEENNKIVAKEKTGFYPESTPRTRREERRSGGKRNSGIVDENFNSDTNAHASPDEKQHSLHLSRERSLKSISNWWKNSLEGGPTPPTWTEGDSPNSQRHNHSHSDSGISSMSGSGRDGKRDFLESIQIRIQY